MRDVSQVQIQFARTRSAVPKSLKVGARFGKPAVGKQRLRQARLDKTILRIVRKRVPEIFDRFAGLPDDRSAFPFL